MSEQRQGWLVYIVIVTAIAWGMFSLAGCSTPHAMNDCGHAHPVMEKCSKAY